MRGRGAAVRVFSGCLDGADVAQAATYGVPGSDVTGWPFAGRLAEHGRRGGVACGLGTGRAVCRTILDRGPGGGSRRPCVGSSSFDDVFWIVDREGTFLEAWGTPGRDEGEFRLNDGTNGYGAIAFRPDGGFYVADSGNARIQQFDADRKIVRTWGAFGTEPESFISPIGIELDGAGDVYVYDDNGRGELKQFGPDGTFRRIVASAVGPYMGVAPDGTIVAFDHRTQALVRMAPDGSRTMALDIGALSTFATDIAIAPDGGIFVASSTGGGNVFEYEHLIELTPDGAVAHIWPDGAEGISLDPAGDRAYLTFSSLNSAIRAVVLPGS